MTVAELPRQFSSAGIAYHRCGEGPAIVLVHGVGLRAESWLPQIEALGGRYTIYAIDLPGHGESVRLARVAPSIRDYTEAVRAFIEEIVAAPVLVAGHSLGALVTVDLAATVPEACRGIAALNGVFQRPQDARGAVEERARRLREQIGAAPDPVMARAPVERWFGTNPTGRNAEMAAACTAWLEANDIAGYAAAYTAFAETDGASAAALPGLAMPALFLTGEHDPNSTPAMSVAMAGRVTGAEAIVVRGAAHMAGLTHPQEVNDVLLDFLGRIGGDTAQ
jgi:pimeloyl-ACP methyl ester carboxylesterase